VTGAVSDADDHTVAFSVGLSNTQHIVDHETIVYDKVFANTHNGYSTSNGVFTCPVAGKFITSYFPSFVKSCCYCFKQCCVEGLWKIYVHLISTLVNKSLYYFNKMHSYLP